MKRVEVYICDFCKNEYKSDIECQAHEYTHSAILSISCAKYTPVEKYPSSITAKFRDGTEQEYYAPEN